MKKILKRNLFLIKKKIHYYLFCSIVLTIKLIYEKDAFNFLIFFIPLMTCISAFIIEEFDTDNYKANFSLPVTRGEFANAKALTILLIFGANTVLSSLIYIAALVMGKTGAIPLSLFVSGLSYAFLWSMIYGGIAITVGNKRNLAYVLIFIITFDIMNISSLIFENTILSYLVSAIFLLIGRTVYIIAKENILRICLEMEL